LTLVATVRVESEVVAVALSVVGDAPATASVPTTRANAIAAA